MALPFTTVRVPRALLAEVEAAAAELAEKHPRLRGNTMSTTALVSHAVPIGLEVLRGECSAVAGDAKLADVLPRLSAADRDLLAALAVRLLAAGSVNRGSHSPKRGKR